MPKNTQLSTRELDNALENAIADCDLNQVKELVEQHGANVNSIDANRRSVLLNAISTDLNNTQSIPVIEYLIQNGANINYATPFYATPYGSNNAGWGYGRTPLLYSISLQNFEVTQLLISYGANIYCQTSLGETPLIAALKLDDRDNKQEKIVKLLLENGAADNIENEPGHGKKDIKIMIGAGDTIVSISDYPINFVFAVCGKNVDSLFTLNVDLLQTLKSHYKYFATIITNSETAANFVIIKKEIDELISNRFKANIFKFIKNGNFEEISTLINNFTKTLDNASTVEKALITPFIDLYKGAFGAALKEKCYSIKTHLNDIENQSKDNSEVFNKLRFLVTEAVKHEWLSIEDQGSILSNISNIEAVENSIFNLLGLPKINDATLSENKDFKTLFKTLYSLFNKKNISISEVSNKQIQSFEQILAQVKVEMNTVHSFMIPNACIPFKKLIKFKDNESNLDIKTYKALSSLTEFTPFLETKEARESYFTLLMLNKFKYVYENLELETNNNNNDLNTLDKLWDSFIEFAAIKFDWNEKQVLAVKEFEHPEEKDKAMLKKAIMFHSLYPQKSNDISIVIREHAVFEAIFEHLKSPYPKDKNQVEDLEGIDIVAYRELITLLAKGILPTILTSRINQKLAEVNSIRPEFFVKIPDIIPSIMASLLREDSKDNVLKRQEKALAAEEEARQKVLKENQAILHKDENFSEKSDNDQEALSIFNIHLFEEVNINGNDSGMHS